MKKIAISDIRSWDPCYDPSRHPPEDWSGTAVDLLMILNIPEKDRLWAVLREEMTDSITLHRFACWCAAEALFRSGWTDPRSFAAIEAKLAFVEGSISASELKSARSAARSAAESDQIAKLIAMIRDGDLGAPRTKKENT